MDELEIRDLIDEAVAALNAGDYVRAVGLGDQLASIAPDRAVVRAIRARRCSAPTLRPNRSRKPAGPSNLPPTTIMPTNCWRWPPGAPGDWGWQESFQKAVVLSERRPAMIGEYAWFMATERGPKLAEQAAREAVEADADSSTAWAALGLAQFRLHRRGDAEESLDRALRLNPNDIYAQSAMVALLQDRHQHGKAEALADLLKEHAGAEDLVSAVRREAKLVRVERMLVERKVDTEQAPSEPRTFRWLWLMIVVAIVAPLLYLIDPWLSYATLALAAVLYVVLWRWMD